MCNVRNEGDRLAWMSAVVVYICIARCVTVDSIKSHLAKKKKASFWLCTLDTSVIVLNTPAHGFSFLAEQCMH